MRVPFSSASHSHTDQISKGHGFGASLLSCCLNCGPATLINAAGKLPWRLGPIRVQWLKDFLSRSATVLSPAAVSKMTAGRSAGSSSLFADRDSLPRIGHLPPADTYFHHIDQHRFYWPRNVRKKAVDCRSFAHDFMVAGLFRGLKTSYAFDLWSRWGVSPSPEARLLLEAARLCCIQSETFRSMGKGSMIHANTPFSSPPPNSSSSSNSHLLLPPSLPPPSLLLPPTSLHVYDSCMIHVVTTMTNVSLCYRPLPSRFFSPRPSHGHG